MAHPRHNPGRYRSRLEGSVAETLQSGVRGSVSYETAKLKWVRPETTHTYTPDFVIERPRKRRVLLEVKGYLTLDDRKKMLFVTEQHPDEIIVMVFDRPSKRIDKRSKTTYAEWCDSKGIRWTTVNQLTTYLKGLK